MARSLLDEASVDSKQNFNSNVMNPLLTLAISCVPSVFELCISLRIKSDISCGIMHCMTNFEISFLIISEPAAKVLVQDSVVWTRYLPVLAGISPVLAQY